jgi:hypothetical protein
MTLGQTVDVSIKTDADRTEVFTIRRVLTLGVDADATSRTLHVVPNPASDVLRIDASAWAPAPNMIRVTMHDLLGRISYEGTFDGPSISIPTELIASATGSSFHTVTVESGTQRRSTSVIIVR